VNDEDVQRLSDEAERGYDVDHLQDKPFAIQDPDVPGERYVSIIRLPDGRWAARNERDVSDVTLEDVGRINQAFLLWVDLLRLRRG
jgi:hypothetical protein